MVYNAKDNNKIATPGGTLVEVCGAITDSPCSVALVTMDKDNNGLKHKHDNLTEIYLFTKGTGKITINEHEHIINPGDIYVIPKENCHQIETISDMEFCCICTPAWTEQHEFEVTQEHPGQDINNTSEFLLQDLPVKIEKKIIDQPIKITEPFYLLKGKGNDLVPGDYVDQEIELIPEEEMIIITVK